MATDNDIVLAAAFVNDDTAAARIWRLARPVIDELWGEESFTIRDAEISLSEVTDYIDETKSDRFTLEANDRPIYTCGENFRLGHYGLTMRALSKTPSDKFDHIFRDDSSALIAARFQSRRFSDRQNETYISELEAAGISYDKSMVYIDRRMKRRVPIDNNPGREVEHRGDLGYLEAVASTMWIGPSFAERTGGDWREMRKYDWCQITEYDNGLVRLESWPQPFDSDQGEQRERQEVLRRVLFPNSGVT